MKSRSTDETLFTLKKRMYMIDGLTQDKLRRMANRNDMSMSQVIRHLVKQSNIVLPKVRKPRR